MVLTASYALFRDAVRALLSAAPGIEVVGGCSNGHEAVALAAQHRPDVVVIDVDHLEPPATVTIPRIHAAAPGTRVAIVGTSGDVDLVRTLMALGARAYLVKNVSREHLLGAIYTLMRDDAQTVLAGSKENLDRLPPLGDDEQSRLTPRERMVLSLAAQGLTNVQTGAALRITTGTVRRHLTNVYRKLGARGRVDAINRAVAAGLISLPIPGYRDSVPPDLDRGP